MMAALLAAALPLPASPASSSLSSSPCASATSRVGKAAPKAADVPLPPSPKRPSWTSHSTTSPVSPTHIALPPLPEPIPSYQETRSATSTPAPADIALPPSPEPSWAPLQPQPRRTTCSVAPTGAPADIALPPSPAPSSMLTPRLLATAPSSNHTPDLPLAQPTPRRLLRHHRSLDELARSRHYKLFGTTPSEQTIRRRTYQDTHMLPTFAPSVGAQLFDTYMEPGWLARGGDAQLKKYERLDLFEENGFRRLTPLPEGSTDESSSEAAETTDAGAKTTDADDGYETIVNSLADDAATMVVAGAAPAFVGRSTARGASAATRSSATRDLPALRRAETRRGKARADVPRITIPEAPSHAVSKPIPMTMSSKARALIESEPSSYWSDSDQEKRSPRLAQMFANMSPLSRQAGRETQRPLTPLNFDKRPIPPLWNEQQQQSTAAATAKTSPARQTTPPALRRTHSTPPPLSRAAQKQSSEKTSSALPQGLRKPRRLRAQTSVARYRGDLPAADSSPDLMERQLALDVVRAMHAARMKGNKPDESDLDSTDTDSASPRSVSKRAGPSGARPVSGTRPGASPDPFLSSMPKVPTLHSSQTSQPDSEMLVTPLTAKRGGDAPEGSATYDQQRTESPFIEEAASQCEQVSATTNECDDSPMLLPDSSGSAATPKVSSADAAPTPRSDAFASLSSETDPLKLPNTSFYASLVRRLGTLASTVKQLSVRTDRRSASTTDLQRVVERPVELPELEDARTLPNGAVGWMKDKDLWKGDAQSTECDLLGCHTVFTLRVRRHHCRHCGGVFCQAHSEYTLPLAVTAEQSGAAGPHVVQLLRCCDLCWDMVYNPGGGANRERWWNGDRSSSEDVRGRRGGRLSDGEESRGHGLTGMQLMKRGSSLSAQGYQTSAPVTLGSGLFESRRKATCVPLGRFQTDPSISHRLQDRTRMTREQARAADPAGYELYGELLADYPLLLPRTQSRTNVTLSPCLSPSSVESRMSSRVGSFQSLAGFGSPSSSHLQLSRTASQSPLRSPTGLLTPPPPVIDENNQLSITNLISTEENFTAARWGFTQEQEPAFDSSDDDPVEYLRMRARRKRRETSVLVVDGDIRYRANLPPSREPEPEPESGPRRSLYAEITF